MFYVTALFVFVYKGNFSAVDITANGYKKQKFTKNLHFLFSLDKMSKFQLKSIQKLQKMLDIYYIIMYNRFTVGKCPRNMINHPQIFA